MFMSVYHFETLGVRYPRTEGYEATEEPEFPECVLNMKLDLKETIFSKIAELVKNETDQTFVEISCIALAGGQKPCTYKGKPYKKQTENKKGGKDKNDEDEHEESTTGTEMEAVALKSIFSPESLGEFLNFINDTDIKFTTAWNFECMDYLLKAKDEECIDLTVKGGINENDENQFEISVILRDDNNKVLEKQKFTHRLKMNPNEEEQIESLMESYIKKKSAEQHYPGPIHAKAQEQQPDTNKSSKSNLPLRKNM
jgi:hypothetical protein